MYNLAVKKIFPRETKIELLLFKITLIDITFSIALKYSIRQKWAGMEDCRGPKVQDGGFNHSAYRTRCRNQRS